MIFFKCVPVLPSERQERSTAQHEEAGDASYHTHNNKRVHQATDADLAQLSQRGSVKDVAYRMRILVLRVLDKPHSTWPHDTPAARKEHSK